MTKLSVRKSYVAARRADLLICFFLVMVTLAAYWQVRDHAFVTYDDDEYVSNNQQVQDGLTLKGIRWAFSFNDVSYWHPLTWLSHMLDWKLYGPQPGMHHTTNLIFHILNALLLFMLIQQMTGARWQSAMIAAIFALHPLNVESVAWVAERKTVLSTFFWMLTVLTYARYVKKPSAFKYVWGLFFFALGLLAKPIILTLPFVLLLLDYWPLGRLRLAQSNGDGSGRVEKIKDCQHQQRSVGYLVGEKAPFFILAFASLYLSVISVRRLDIAISTELIPMITRCANALVSYIRYLGKIFWPQDLTFIYPYPEMVPMWQAVASGFMLLSITVLLLWKLRGRSYLTVGWLWYLGTLIPVIGLVQAGFWPAMADRFTYVPAIGLFIIIAWGLPDLLSEWRYQKIGLATVSGVVLLFLMLATSKQIGYWHNSFSLFQHAIAITDNNYLVHNNLGNVYLHQGQPSEAIGHYAESLRINPDFAPAHNNLGAAMLRTGDIEKAIFHFRMATNLKPDDTDARNNLNKTLAVKHYRSGDRHLAIGELKQAREQYQAAISIHPQYVPALNKLGTVYLRDENYEKALAVFSEVVTLQPNKPDAYYNIARIFSKLNRVEESVDWLSKAIEQGFNNWDFLNTDRNLENVRGSLAYQKLIKEGQR
jgi:tetratricopeptide (TPR) repeat protein